MHQQEYKWTDTRGEKSRDKKSASESFDLCHLQDSSFPTGITNTPSSSNAFASFSSTTFIAESSTGTSASRCSPKSVPRHKVDPSGRLPTTSLRVDTIGSSSLCIPGFKIRSSQPSRYQESCRTESASSSPSDRNTSSPTDTNITTSSQVSAASSFSSISSNTTRSAHSESVKSHPYTPPVSRNVELAHATESYGNTLRGDQGSPVGTKRGPRRTNPPKSFKPPCLLRQDCRRRFFVEQLVDAAYHLIVMIWPEADASKVFQAPVLTLRYFIRETLRRSGTSYSTLQLTLYYLTLIKPHATEARSSLPSDDTTTRSCPNLVQTESSTSRSSSDVAGTGSAAEGTSSFDESSRSLCCGRRMFLAALILASKFLQDRNFTARAWSRVTGLATNDIVGNERTFLLMIRWNLHLGQSEFAHWSSIIMRCTASTQKGNDIRHTWFWTLHWLSQGLTLEHTNKQLKCQDELRQLELRIKSSAESKSKAYKGTDNHSSGLSDRLEKRGADYIDTKCLVTESQTDGSKLPSQPLLQCAWPTPVEATVRAAPPRDASALRRSALDDFAACDQHADAHPHPATRVASTLYGPVKASEPDGWSIITNEFSMTTVASPESLQATEDTTLHDRIAALEASTGSAICNYAFGIVTPSETPMLPPAGSNDNDAEPDHIDEFVWSSSQSESTNTLKSESTGSPEMPIRQRLKFASENEQRTKDAAMSNSHSSSTESKSQDRHGLLPASRPRASGEFCILATDPTALTKAPPKIEHVAILTSASPETAFVRTSISPGVVTTDAKAPSSTSTEMDDSFYSLKELAAPTDVLSGSQVHYHIGSRGVTSINVGSQVNHQPESPKISISPPMASESHADPLRHIFVGEAKGTSCHKDESEETYLYEELEESFETHFQPRKPKSLKRKTSKQGLSSMPPKKQARSGKKEDAVKLAYMKRNTSRCSR